MKPAHLPFLPRAVAPPRRPACLRPQRRRGHVGWCALVALGGGGCADEGAKHADPGPPVELVPYVEPVISTGGDGFGVGCGYPGAAVPLGLVKVSPDTANQYGAAPGVYHGGGYHANDSHITAFSHIHLHGVGLTDYGLLGFMPVDGMTEARRTDVGHMAAFSHTQEVASAGLYSVTLDDPAIGVRLSATEHTAVHEYSFPADVVDPTVLIDLGHVMDGGVVWSSGLQLDAESGTLEGWITQDGAMAAPFTLWFKAAFDQPIVGYGVWTDEGLQEGSAAVSTSDPGVGVEGIEISGVRNGAWLRFSGGTVRARVAVSLTDAAGARANFELEDAHGFDVEATAAAAAEAWEETFRPVSVWGGTEEERVLFASALYHSNLMPQRMGDADGRYLGFDGGLHLEAGSRYFSDMSLWDTYRTTHPLYTLLWPEAHQEMLRSLSRMAEQGGALPKWPIATWDGGFMVGSPAHIVAAEAWQKGLRDFGEDSLFTSALDMARGRGSPLYGARPDVATYDTYGYYPADLIGTSVSWTQEVAIADYALAQVDLLPTEERAFLADRANAWKELYDPAVGYFHGRNSDGSWVDFPGDGQWLDEYSEGNARQYLWLVHHDVPGLFEVLGGEATAVERLSDFFIESDQALYEVDRGFPQPWYWHGNEPDLQAAWLFSVADRPELSSQWVRWVRETWYGTGADGLAGNDDGGTLSAWYVWAALGLYPLAGTDQYLLADPVFPRASVRVGDGTFLITREGASREGGGGSLEITLDGEPLPHAWIRHEQIQPGGHLAFRWSAP